MQSTYRIVAAATITMVGINAVNVEAATINYFTDLSLFNAETSTTLIEDFEAVTPKDTPLSSFNSNGNTYTALNSSPFAPNVGVASPGYTNFGVPITTSSILAANGDEDFMIDFGAPKPVVGFDTYLNAFGSANIEVFGSGGLLDTYTLNQDPTTIGFLGIVASEPITSLRWTTVNGRAINTGLDNIRTGTVNSANVPEPTAIAGLLITGISLLFAKRR